MGAKTGNAARAADSVAAGYASHSASAAMVGRARVCRQVVQKDKFVGGEEG